jgi:microcystin-dependent protein
MYGASTAPTNFLSCDGTSYSRTTYATLFAVIGTSFGAIDVDSFSVPDFRGVFPRGWNDTNTNLYADPDRLTRTALYTGGATGNNVGSYQADAY